MITTRPANGNYLDNLSIELLMEIFFQSHTCFPEDTFLTYLKQKGIKSEDEAYFQFFWKQKFIKHFTFTFGNDHHLQYLIKKSEQKDDGSCSLIELSNEPQKDKLDELTMISTHSAYVYVPNEQFIYYIDKKRKVVELCLIENGNFLDSYDFLPKENLEKILKLLPRKPGKEKILTHDELRQLSLLSYHAHSLDWYDQFCITINSYYFGLSNEEKKIFLLVKEENVDELEKIIEFKHLFLANIHNRMLYSLIFEQYSHNQALLDLVYRISIRDFYSDKNQKIIYTKKCSNSENKSIMYCGLTLLHWAAHCNQSLRVVQDLAKHCNTEETDQYRNTALSYAIKYGNTQIILFLIEKLDSSRADTQAKNVKLTKAYAEATLYGHIELCKTLLYRDQQIQVELDQEINLEENKKKARINKSEFDILQFALNAYKKESNEKQKKLIEFLLKNGFTVDMNKKNQLIREALRLDDANIIELLFQYHINIDFKDTTWEWIIHSAISLNNSQIFELFLQNGYLINSIISIARTNKTALMWAVDLKLIDMVRFLLNHGAQLELKDKDNKTITVFNKSNMNPEIHAMLIKHQIKLSLIGYLNNQGATVSKHRTFFSFLPTPNQIQLVPAKKLLEKIEKDDPFSHDIHKDLDLNPGITQIDDDVKSIYNSYCSLLAKPKEGTKNNAKQEQDPDYVGISVTLNT